MVGLREIVWFYFAATGGVLAFGYAQRHGAAIALLAAPCGLLLGLVAGVFLWMTQEELEDRERQARAAGRRTLAGLFHAMSVTLWVSAIAALLWAGVGALPARHSGGHNPTLRVGFSPRPPA